MIDRPPPRQLLGFLERYNPAVADLALALREIVLNEAPDALEAIYDSYTVAMWFGFGGSKEWFCYITSHAKHVNLGFPFGATLPDPRGVLAGEGKTNRHISFSTQADLARPFVRRFLRDAIEQTGAAGRGSGQSVIKPTKRTSGGVAPRKKVVRKPRS